MPPPILTVSQLSVQVRRSLESGFPLLWVCGEISNLVRAASGHVYFSLKDEHAQLRCVMFRARAQLAGWQLANGQQVEVNARVTLYEPRGDVQLSIENVRRAGLGKLYEAFARLREQLEAEGLFAQERKRSLPAYPGCIGIITSPTAAAFHDVLVSLRRRAPHVFVVLYPTRVQGTEASTGIKRALAAANAAGRCDVLLLVRGGGSIEDLWPFNEEATARAISASAIPVVSGVGHETDLTISDLIADQRAATPTAAAELVSAGWLAATHSVHRLHLRLSGLMARRLGDQAQRLDLLSARLTHPATRLRYLMNQTDWLANRLKLATRQHLLATGFRLREARTRLHANRPHMDIRQETHTRLARRLHAAMDAYLLKQRTALSHTAQALEHLAPDRTLARGYAIVRTHEGTVTLDPIHLREAPWFNIQLAQGSLKARALSADDAEK